MLTFIIGRAFRSFLVIFIAALLLHTIVLIYLPDKLQADYSAYFGDTRDNTAQGPRPQWPAEFFLWLFHTRTDAQDPNDQYGIGMGATPITEIKFGDVDIKGSGALTGDFGISTIVGKGIPARDVIASRWGNTLALVITALIPTILIGVPLGVFAASRKGST